MYIVSLFGLISQRFSLLNTLIILEGLTLSMFMLVGFYMTLQIWILPIMLVVMASEGTIGLSMLIVLSRRHGVDSSYVWNSN